MFAEIDLSEKMIKFGSHFSTLSGVADDTPIKHTFSVDAVLKPADKWGSTLNASLVVQIYS